MKTITKKMADRLNRCAWCGVKIKDHMPVCAIPAKLHQETVTNRISVPMNLVCGKVVRLVLVAEDSPAKRDGWDGFILACGDDCGHQLIGALRNEGIMTVADLN